MRPRLRESLALLMRVSRVKAWEAAADPETSQRGPFS